MRLTAHKNKKFLISLFTSCGCNLTAADGKMTLFWIILHQWKSSIVEDATSRCKQVTSCCLWIQDLLSVSTVLNWTNVRPVGSFQQFIASSIIEDFHSWKITQNRVKLPSAAVKLEPRLVQRSPNRTTTCIPPIS